MLHSGGSAVVGTMFFVYNLVSIFLVIFILSSNFVEIDGIFSLSRKK